MSEFGHYGVYIWLAYALTFLLLIGMFIKVFHVYATLKKIMDHIDCNGIK